MIAGGRTVEYLGLLGTLGLLSLAALAGGAGSSWRPRGLHRWVMVAAAGGLLTVGDEILLAAGGSPVSAARSFLLAASGWPRLARLLIEIAAVAVAVRAASRSDDGTVAQRPARVWVPLLTLVSLAALSAAGHAAAAGGYGIVADALHLWTAGVWAGSIIVMALQRPPAAGGATPDVS